MNHEDLNEFEAATALSHTLKKNGVKHAVIGGQAARMLGNLRQTNASGLLRESKTSRVFAKWYSRILTYLSMATDTMSAISLLKLMVDLCTLDTNSCFKRYVGDFRTL